MKRVSASSAPRLSAGAASAAGRVSSAPHESRSTLPLPHPPISKGGAVSMPGKGAIKGGGAGLCKGKKGGKTISTARMNDSYVVSFPNALPVKQVIWARDSLAGVWRLCSIVHARLRSARPGEASSSSSSSSSEARPGLEPSPDNYDYYVHFLGFDRRLDQWKAWEEIRENESDLPPNEPCVKEVPDSSDDEHAGMDEEYLREHEEATKVKSINKIRMGRYSVDTWYFSPYPKLFQNVHTLHICEFCLTFFRDNDIAMFEVDGNHCRVYCENLCFLSKLFLDHKTLRHPVSLFLFYVMTEIDEKGYHITGYFSKEKYSKNNVSCILTLPQHQRKGYGKFLINFSYALSRAERKAGTPERPLSDLGKASYIAFWTEAILALVERHKGRISVQDLSRLTCIEQADILACLEHHGVLKSKGDCFFLVLPQQKIKSLKEAAGRPSRTVKAEELHWIPYDRYLMPFEYSPQA
ncbi:moz/SAS family protein, related [Neospora caninum Liverpool]|uniref:Histone acetyltransferase n=1 Tax=Neospora caninum (strain Liverpool) TaxID=572307 RepID=F0VAG3_NEOCL|nr:moz/SAS family protein, related [Neospora caninum Liverpool]CBZ50652.1 moz/SAS family protein, related [Neospora caninum Liverpool]CEL65264.1 TPA: MOZ/SAS family protein, related [Neospora caninum Liverpool]|eukprot:XP_003880685.1 moz/SAS family protein, related [Neospora caninum Liverpool]